MDTRLFGRFVVSLPDVNTVGVIADSAEVASLLVGEAIQVADDFNAKNLELRHEQLVEHPKLVHQVTDKVHMRLALPATDEELWSQLKSKVRSQIRKPQRNTDFSVEWGGVELLDQFYDVFCQNMRDLGTPPFGKALLASILDAFTDSAEICCVRLGGSTVASALLIHGPGTTQVPSSSSLRRVNSTNANMLMYWHLLERSIQRGQSEFDFGRSSKDSGTFRFKKQWGATPHPAAWQHYVREGSAEDMRPSSGKYDLMIKTWKKLPVGVTRLIGPSIVRGIP
ncbi:MAG: exosortase [Planctomycetaceae bacterium]|nr:exosortase [Planctomycetaceae bacterium]